MMSIEQIKSTREYNDLLNMYVDDGFSLQKAERMAMSDMLMALK